MKHLKGTKETARRARTDAYEMRSWRATSRRMGVSFLFFSKTTDSPLDSRCIRISRLKRSCELETERQSRCDSSFVQYTMHFFSCTCPFELGSNACSTFSCDGCLLRQQAKDAQRLPQHRYSTATAPLLLPHQRLRSRHGSTTTRRTAPLPPGSAE